MGHVQLHRKIMNSEVWKQNPSIRIMFLHLVMRANFKDVYANGRLFKRGEFVTSYQTLSEECNVSKDTVGRCLKWLGEKDYIKILSNGKSCTHIRIPNYEIYQAQEPTNNEEKIPDSKPSLKVIGGGKE